MMALVNNLGYHTEMARHSIFLLELNNLEQKFKATQGHRKL